MNTKFLSCRPLLGLLAVSLAALGCNLNAAPQGDPVKPADPGAGAKRVAFGKNVTLEIEGGTRRVLVNAVVCRRMEQLEQLLCRKRTKEHEAVLAADVDARQIHAALLAAGAEPGSPVKFQPKLTAPTGTVIKVSLRYTEKGQTVTVPAQQWVRSAKTKKVLEHDWVFAGSLLFPDPIDKTKPPFYAANDGDVICVANFESAMLDLAVVSSKDNDDLSYEANTERIPALETPVVVILEPVLPKKK